VSTPHPTDLCRVVVATPQGPIEMALPAGVPVCDLLPVLVAHATAGQRQDAADEPWVLQRLGHAPLNGDLTVAALGVRDGETLYLRPADQKLPAADFDDLVEGLATGMNGRADNWADHMTRWLFLGLSGASLALGLVLLLGGGPVAGRASLAGTASVLLLFAGAVCSRAFGQAAPGLLFGAAAIPYAALAGLLVPSLSGPQPTLGAPAVLTGTTAAVLAAVLALGVIGTGRPGFLAIALSCAAGQAGALLAAVAGLGAAQAAAIVAAAVLAASTFIPTISFRLARLTLPALPTSAADLSDDIEPHRVGQVLAGTDRVDGYVTALFGVVGAVCAGALAVLARAEGPTAAALVVAISWVLLIRSRGLRSAWQRLATILPAVLGLALLTTGLAAGAAWPAPAGATVAALGAAALAAALAHAMPGRRLLPYWGRLADIAEYAAAIAVLPLTLGVLGAFGWARALGG